MTTPASIPASPNFPRGGVQAKRPKPFSRPAVSVSVNERKRAWGHVRADRLQIGDTVAVAGTIVHASAMDSGRIVIEYASGHFQRYAPDEILYVHCLAAG